MRWLILCCLATPLPAWEFTPDPICTLSHQGPSGEIVITYDAILPEYTLRITAVRPWAQSERFEIKFRGDRGFTISTDRHTYSADGMTLTVTDRGFGNVLDGIGSNVLLSASDGDLPHNFQTASANGPLAAFRRCPAPATS